MIAEHSRIAERRGPAWPSRATSQIVESMLNGQRGFPLVRGAGGPDPFEGVAVDGFELTDMTGMNVGEERAQRRRGHHPMPQDTPSVDPARSTSAWSICGLRLRGRLAAAGGLVRWGCQCALDAIEGLKREGRIGAVRPSQRRCLPTGRLGLCAVAVLPELDHAGGCGVLDPVELSAQRELGSVSHWCRTRSESSPSRVTWLIDERACRSRFPRETCWSRDRWAPFPRL